MKNFNSRPDKSLKDNELIQEQNKLQNIYSNYVEQMKKEGVPLTIDGRIDMDLFEKYFGEKTIQKDKQYINKIASSPTFNENNMGEIAELLIPIIFNKLANNKYLTFRSSVYDDIRNGVDTIIVDKNTGKIVCAVDEASSISSPFFINKQKKVASLNKKGGATIKYGLYYNKGVVKLTSMQKVPIFVLAFPMSELKTTLKNLDFSKESDELTKTLFNFFVALINSQSKKENLDFHLDLI